MDVEKKIADAASPGAQRTAGGSPAPDGVAAGGSNDPRAWQTVVARAAAPDIIPGLNDGVLAVLADLDDAAPRPGDVGSDGTNASYAPAGETETAPCRPLVRRPAAASPISLLAKLAVAATLPRDVRRALRRGSPVVVVIEVPTAAWVEPMRDAVDLASTRPIEFVVRDARPRLSTLGWERSGPATAVASPMVAITPVQDWLSPVTVAAADHVVIVPPLDARLVNGALARWTGDRPADPITAGDLAGLDLPDIAMALRQGAGADESVARIRRASRSRVGLPEGQAVTPLAELTGYGEAHAWATDLVADIARVRRGEMKAALLEGAIFHGPSGTGKTTLARSIAAAAGVRFVETTVGQWFSQSAGHLDGVIKMVDAFCDALAAAAKADGTAVGHCDECEAIPNRARLSDRGAAWWLPVVTHVLVRFEALRRSGVILLGSTNDLSRVDEALRRPGRFDRQFLIEPPSEVARVGILRNHLGGDLAGVDLTPAARLAVGATGAVLAGHVRAARRKSMAAGRPMVLDDLLAEIVPAERRASALARSAALHEAGHAVAAYRLGFTVVEVTTLAGPRQGGSTRFRVGNPSPDRASVERYVTCMLGGRAADVVLGTGPDSGSASDLLESTRLLASVHASFGLGATLAVLVEDERAETLLPLRPALEKIVEADLCRLAIEAELLVRDNRDAVLAVAEALLARRVLTGSEVKDIVAEHPPRPLPGPPRSAHPNGNPR